MKLHLWGVSKSPSNRLSDIKGPFDAFGKGMDVWPREVSEYLGTSVVEDVEFGTMTLERGGVLLDRIKDSRLIVSSRLRAILGRYSAKGEMRFIPLQFSSFDKKQLPEYFFVFPLIRHPLAVCEGSRKTGHKDFRDHRPFIVNERLAPSRHFFIDDGVDWYVDDELKSEILAAGCTGSVFTEVEVRP